MNRFLAVLGVLALAATASSAETLGQQSATIPAGSAVAQGFYLNASGEVTVSFNPGLAAAIATWADCQKMQSQGTPIASVINNAVSTSGRLTINLPAGQYCAVVANQGSSAVQASMTVTAERR